MSGWTPRSGRSATARPAPRSGSSRDSCTTRSSTLSTSRSSSDQLRAASARVSLLGERLRADPEEALEAAQPHLELEQLRGLAGGRHLLGEALAAGCAAARSAPRACRCAVPLRRLSPSDADYSPCGVDRPRAGAGKIEGCYLTEFQPLEPARTPTTGSRASPCATRSWPSPRSSSWSSSPSGASRRQSQGLRAAGPASSRGIGSVWTAVLLSVVYLVSVGPIGLGDAALRQGPARPGAHARAQLLARARAQPARPRARRPPPVLMSATPTYVLGLSCFYHDSAAALLKDGVVIAAGQEERFSRKRHDSGFPHLAIQYVLHEAGIKAEELDAVGFYDKPLLKFERMLSTYVATFPRSFASFRKAMPVWLHEKLWVPSIIRKELKPYAGPILFAEHHMSHAASCFLPSPFEEAAILTVDGVGEWATASFGVGPRQRHHAVQGDPLPAQPGAALLRVHLLPRLQGQQRRVQGDGARALRQAGPLRAHHEGHGPPERGRLVQAQHEVLLVRLRAAHDQRGLRRVLRRPAAQARDLDDRARVRHRRLGAEGVRGGRAARWCATCTRRPASTSCAWPAASRSTAWRTAA